MTPAALSGQICHDAAFRQKAQFMMNQLLKRTVVADRRVAHAVQILCSLVAGLVLLLGFRRLNELELSEAQMFSASVQPLLLAGIFIILGFQCRAWRRAA